MPTFNLDYSVLAEIALALALGALVGIEREFHRTVEKKVNYLGVRTSMLLSLLGFIFGNIYASTVNSPLVLIAAFGIITVISSLVYWAKFMLHKAAGATTYTAMFLVFMGGVMVGLGLAFLAAIVIIIATSLLAVKEEFAEFVIILNKNEILSAIKFAIIAFVILPFLPNRTLDPWNVFNPFSFWLIVVVFSSINFASFILSKVHKEGLFLGSLTGGFVSSSAVTYSLVRMFGKREVDHKTTLAGILVSDVGMILSQVLIISLLVYGNVSVLRYIFIPVAVPALLLVAYSLMLGRRPVKRITMESPFSLKSALTFALLFFLISILSLVFKDSAGQSSLYALSVISSIANVGATVASMGLLAAGGVISLKMFGLLTIISMAVGMMSKLVWILGHKNRGMLRKVLVPSVLLSALSIALYFAQFLFIG